MTAAAALECRGLVQRFGGVRALNDVSFELEAGSIVGLIGPNGAGKSTLFNAVVGLVPPLGGEVFLWGQQITGLSPHAVCRLGLTKTSQKVQVFGDMSVVDNVMVGAILRARSTAEARQLALAELKLLGLDREVDLPANSLTLVDRTRLELARALSSQPRILLVDELMAGLNAVEIAQTLALLKDINRHRETTLLVIEHNMAAITSICPRILVLVDGRIIADGTPHEVSHNQAVIEAYLGVPESAIADD
jgi:branched-chain amino acid transport system ATP-binding protein